MGDRVWQVQKELEELQAKTHSTPEVQMSDLLYIFTGSSGVCDWCHNFVISPTGADFHTWTYLSPVIV